jgi:hypothetical protein
MLGVDYPSNAGAARRNPSQYSRLVYVGVHDVWLDSPDKPVKLA